MRDDEKEETVTPTETTAPTLDQLVTDLAGALLDEAAAERDAARDLPSLESAARRTRAGVLVQLSRRLREALVRVEPRYRYGDGYSEAWEVTCPAGCGQILDYQRYLVAGAGPGRWVDEDRVLFACQRCGHDLDDAHPALDELVRAQNATARVA